LPYFSTNQSTNETATKLSIYTANSLSYFTTNQSTNETTTKLSIKKANSSPYNTTKFATFEVSKHKTQQSAIHQAKHATE
jgi:phosphorylcholine metabolism protein LicD